MIKLTTEKLGANITRVRYGGHLFGQIKHIGREWHAEIRQTDTGTLVRFAGIWNRRRDAVEEVEHILTARAKFEQ